MADGQTVNAENARARHDKLVAVTEVQEGFGADEC
jgi:hypothetical protein